MNYKSEILKLVKAQHKEQIKVRRHIHQYPELSYQEYKTTSFLKEQMSKLGLKILPLKMKTGLLAELKGNHPGPTIAIRTDIDALPILEKTNLPFKSKINGCMHACGHDMHMATIWGTAKVLSQMKDKIHGSIRFIFQPAEEFPPGGAKEMIEKGCLKNVSMIFGLHVDPDVATGKIGLRDGVTMASVTDLDIIIHGTGGHAARPHNAVDAVVVAAEIIESIQKIVSREVDPINPAVITFGKIEGGTVRNIIADKVTLTGTIRTLTKEDSKKIPKLVKRKIDAICKANSAKAEINILAAYPVLDNNAKVNQIYNRNFEYLFGKGKIEMTPQTLGGEDFAYFQKIVPGATFRIGVMNKKIGADKPWHSPKFISDEDSLIYSTALFCSSTLDYLSEK